MKIAFVFPGQGSQKVGMLDSVAQHATVKQLAHEAQLALGFDLAGLIAQGPAEALALTTNTQPAMLLTSVALASLWREAGGPEASVMAGHSLGEYSALCMAGALTPAQGVALVRKRADAMQSAVPVGEGTMAAILGLADEIVIQACAQVEQELPGQIVEAVNFNAPSQVVIAGHTGAVQRACEVLKAAGAKRALVLPVSAPFHSRLIAPAGPTLAQALAEVGLKTLQTPVINNVDVASPNDPSSVMDALVRQASSPVRWVEIVQAMQKRGVTHAIEFGPGKVLCGLIDRIAPAIETLSVSDAASLDAGLGRLREAA
jgi:[acyl-carrier-protein] S-malonyltransferase